MRRRTIGLAAAIIAFATNAAADDKHIGLIDFFGYTGLDLAQVRALLPFHVGDPLPSRTARASAEIALAKAVDRKRVKMNILCCLPDGRSTLYVGFEAPGVPGPEFLPRPTGPIKLPVEIVKLSDDSERLNSEAVSKGVAGEDDSQGYALSEYPPSREVELKIHEYARTHTSVLVEVLESSADDHHRAAAAEALGYAGESTTQIAALVRASLDSYEDVRNNVIRALGVLVRYDPKILPQIQLKPYIALMNSIDWTDRNKAAFLIEAFTESRNPDVLKTLRDGALTPIKEMAQWKDESHAISAIQALGRIAGMDEQQIVGAILQHNIAPILEAVQ